jgi:hypothetical protein
MFHGGAKGLDIHKIFFVRPYHARKLLGPLLLQEKTIKQKQCFGLTKSIILFARWRFMQNKVAERFSFLPPLVSATRNVLEKRPNDVFQQCSAFFNNFRRFSTIFAKKGIFQCYIMKYFGKATSRCYDNNFRHFSTIVGQKMAFSQQPMLQSNVCKN